MDRRIEFIESYRKFGNDYQWNDNHGELVRCKDCKRYIRCTDYQGLCDRIDGLINPDWYCADGERKDERVE